MTTFSLEQLDDLRVASPCPVRWDDLEGDGATRHCRRCNLNVHDFSQMSPAEIQRVIAETEGRVCAGFYRRADGTILTRDCPVGLRAVRQRTVRTVARIAAAVTLLLVGSIALATGQRRERIRSLPPFQPVCDWLAPSAAVPPPPGPWIAGEICVPAPPPAPPGSPGLGTAPVPDPGLAPATGDA